MTIAGPAQSATGLNNPNPNNIKFLKELFLEKTGGDSDFKKRPGFKSRSK